MITHKKFKRTYNKTNNQRINACSYNYSTENFGSVDYQLLAITLIGIGFVASKKRIQKWKTELELCFIFSLQPIELNFKLNE